MIPMRANMVGCHPPRPKSTVHRGLPLRRLMLLRRQNADVLAGVKQRHQLAAVWQHDRLVEKRTRSCLRQQILARRQEPHIGATFVHIEPTALDCRLDASAERIAPGGTRSPTSIHTSQQKTCFVTCLNRPFCNKIGPQLKSLSRRGVRCRR